MEGTMSQTSKQPTISEWLRTVISGAPHMVIGDDSDPYLLRWYVIPRNPFVNMYVHKFLRDDDDRGLHDHPWWFVSIILHGGYIEETETADWKMKLRCRSALFDIKSPWRHRSIAYRPATWRHRVVLPHTPTGGRVPCWTLIITGRRTRVWGFWCREFTGSGRRIGARFVPWYTFAESGCDEP